MMVTYLDTDWEQELIHFSTLDTLNFTFTQPGLACSLNAVHQYNTTDFIHSLWLALLDGAVIYYSWDPFGW